MQKESVFLRIIKNKQTNNKINQQSIAPYSIPHFQSVWGPLHCNWIFGLANNNHRQAINP